ncbi:MAG: hypothetical protein Q7I97_01540 [Thermovirgaceae bacterium]|nr:hypothetical protein [Thermovirgaceae bacterium]
MAESRKTTKQKIVCALTRREGKPIKCHIVPRSFYEDMLDQEDGPCRLYSNIPGTYVRRIPVGGYDAGIVTLEGERILSRYDDYASDLLLKNVEALQPFMVKDNLEAWRIKQYDYKLLKGFVLSLLWRMHVSTRKEYIKVQLADYMEEELRKIIIEEKEIDPDRYSVILCRWLDKGFGPVMLNPDRPREKGVNFYRVFFGIYFALIKVDRRPTPDPFSEFMLTPGKDLQIISKDLKESKEWQLMGKIARANEK